MAVETAAMLLLLLLLLLLLITWFLSNMQVGDAKSQGTASHVDQTGLEHLLPEFDGIGEGIHRVGKITVGLTIAGNDASDEGHHAVEIEPEEGAEKGPFNP